MIFGDDILYDENTVLFKLVHNYIVKSIDLGKIIITLAIYLRHVHKSTTYAVIVLWKFFIILIV